MRNSKMLSANEMQAVKRLQKLNEPEIRTYVDSLQRTYAKYQQPLSAGRKIIDDAMKTASLTDVLHECRE